MDKAMANLLKNTSKRGAFVNRGLYDKSGTHWVIEKL